MAISFVAGSMLNSNLVRDTDLAFNGNLLYIDYTGNTVGVGTSSPATAFEVVGNITVGNIVVPNVGNVSLGNVNINYLANPVANSDAATKFYVDSATGNIGNIGNLTVSNTTISTSLANGNITLTATGTGIVTVSGTAAVNIPAGTTAQRPAAGNVAGTLRFNTDNLRLEVYDGTEWDQVVGGVTSQTLNGDGSSVSFALDRVTTTAGALIMLNGVVQLPAIAYNISPNPGNTLVFTEAPVSTDVIDVRYL